MAFIFGKIKCYFCQEKNGLMQSVCRYGIYGDNDVEGRLFYHDECLKMVELSPEKFGNIAMDKAIEINDLKRRNRCFNNGIIENFEKKVEKLNASHFKRMIPLRKGK